jgi:hypothetical protein
LVCAQGSAEPNREHKVSWHVDCSGTAAIADGSIAAPFRTIQQANELALNPGDQLLFKRRSHCTGELMPKGSGTLADPILIGAYGDGPLPRIEAASTDLAALRIFNQQFLEVSSLELQGGTEYGLFVSGDAGVLHHLRFRDLHIHEVRGPLKRKESGLVVILPSNKTTLFEDVELDGVQAWNTTQWSGIFVSGASHVRIRNSLVHDVQGDGIVVFESRDALIARSVAWHTGMQEAQTIGTPNAIWTWRCQDCAVEDNEAFLSDSPGVDGGSFDIDFGNARNTVERNFGHDTAGYCVSVFGAFGPTTGSVVSGNVCVHNGMSTRLAQRQGALLLMTWSGGTLEGVDIHSNRVDWKPAGDTPAIRVGSQTQSSGVKLQGNEIWSTGSNFVDPGLKYMGEHNRYVTTSIDPGDLQRALLELPPTKESNSTVSSSPMDASGSSVFGRLPDPPGGWKLEVTIPAATQPNQSEDNLRGTLIELQSAMAQYGHKGLEVIISADSGSEPMLRDWLLPANGIRLETAPAANKLVFSVEFVSPEGKVVREWRAYPSPVDLGLELRQRLGAPEFSQLKFEDIPATD